MVFAADVTAVVAADLAGKAVFAVMFPKTSGILFRHIDFPFQSRILFKCHGRFRQKSAAFQA